MFLFIVQLDLTRFFLVSSGERIGNGLADGLALLGGHDEQKHHSLQRVQDQRVQGPHHWAWTALRRCCASSVGVSTIFAEVHTTYNSVQVSII